MEVAQDISGIERYAGELFVSAARAGAAARVPDEEESAAPPVPAPYRGWIEFLLRLDKRVKQFPELARALHADTLQGLEAVNAARLKFQREHKACPGCGSWIAAYALNCICGWKEKKGV